MIHKVKEHLQKHRAYDIGVILLVGLAAAGNWLNLELPKGHDAVADMLSAQATYNSLFIHHALPGWSTDWFMGYVQFSVYSPLSSLLVLFSSLLFGWVLGTKLLFLSFFALSGVFAYLYVHELTRDRLASIVAGLAYVFVPYHIIDVGFEGHQGSFSTPYMLLPLTLLLLERSIQRPSLKYVLVNGVLLALLTLTFPQVLPILVGPFLVTYVILRIWWERHRGQEYLKAAIMTSAAALCISLLLAAFWWLPLMSEIRYSFDTSFSIEDARFYSATFLQAITLRPSLDCAPSSAFGSAGSVFLEILRTIPFLLVLLGIILNRRNRYVWFFSVSILVAVCLAMGPQSFINLYGLARHVPLFDRLRTPLRFLFFASFAYAVLIGFCVHAVAARLGRLRSPKLRTTALPLLVPILVGLVVVGNTWQETRTAFSTFSLTGDTNDAMVWLAEREGGDYRIADPPFDAYTYDDQAGEMIRPVFWTYLHGKETLSGPGLAMAVKYTATTLQSLNAEIEKGPFDLSQWLSIFNVKYVLLDKTNPLSSNVILDDSFEVVWTSNTIDIYENRDMLPRVFAVTLANERTVDLWSGDRITASPTDNNTTLSLDSQVTRSFDRTLKATYAFTQQELDTASLAIDIQHLSLSANDAIHLVFYSDRNLPDMSMSLDLFEHDGSRYGANVLRTDGIKTGWNEINFPLSLFSLRDSADENDRLDADQVQTLAFGPTEQSNLQEEHQFSLYFDKVSLVTQDIDTSVEYTKIRPGKYELQVDLDSPSYLVLSESYHPGWVAHINGEKIDSQMMYECLNSFYLEPGEYDVTLEFTTSPLRVAADIISGVTAIAVCAAVVFLLLRRWHQKRRTRQAPTHPAAPTDPPS